jgi:hypothetical protein
VIALVVVPVAVGVLLLLFSEPLARRLRPSLAVPLLTALSLSVALCTGLALSAAALLVCVRIGPLPRLGRWSATAIRARSEDPEPLGLAATLVVAACLAAAVVFAARSLREWRLVGRAAALMRPGAGALVVVDDDVPTAYAVGGPRGRIVVSRSMLGALSAAERRVLIAHEAAHLRHHHHVYGYLARLGAAANPLLRPTATAVVRAIERWADEDAAQELGDRRLAACALARAALARAGHPPVRRALAAADDRIADRVRLLLLPPASQKRLPVALVVAAGLASWLAAGTLTLWTNNVIQVAEALYPHR